MQREMLRAAEVGMALHISRSYAYRLIKRGVIPAVKIGGGVRVPRVAFERWLERQSEAALQRYEEAAHAGA